jgi:hypothetical protein
MFQEPLEEPVFHPGQARFAQEDDPEQQNHEHEPWRRSLHRG